MDHHQIMLAVYAHFIAMMKNNVIPVNLRAPALVGTVQDDPFDCMVFLEVKKTLPEMEVVQAGKLTTPDIIIRDRKTGSTVGLEVKKLIQKTTGADARGLTLDYNSCLPCGSALIKVGDDTVVIPCYYFYSLLDPSSENIVTLILMDGDFINYDFNLHKKAKVSNVSEYNHGPYGEGSVRHRDMYTYPNPLNSKLSVFHLRKTFVIKSNDADNMKIHERSTHSIRRDDIFGNSFHYSVIDYSVDPTKAEPALVTDIFADCKKRKPKERTPSIVRLEAT